MSTTDVKICDYLTKFYSATYVIGFFNNKNIIITKAKPIMIYVKPMRVPFLHGFILSLIAFFKLVKIRPTTVMWSWGCFFPGGLLLKLLFPYIKIVVDIRSHPISLKSKFLSMLYNAYFVWILRLADIFVDCFTIISYSMWIYITKRFRFRTNKKVCIWQSGFDEELFNYYRETGYKYLTRLRRILEIEENTKVLIYYGNISYSRLPIFKLLIQTVNLLKKDYQNIKLLIVGKGDAVSDVRNLINASDLKDKVHILPAVSHSMIPLMLILSDIVITPFPYDYNWLTQVPLKVIEALGMEKHILTTTLIELKKLLPSEYLINFDDLSPITLKNKIEALLFKNSQRHFPRSINVSDLSWNAIAKKLYKCLEEIKVIKS
ncbi:MAG: glycosyltransferase [Candidatus Bathyarchaeia archaeon]